MRKSKAIHGARRAAIGEATRALNKTKNRPASSLFVTFGPYRGIRWSGVPDGYLKELIDKRHSKHRRLAKRVLQERSDFAFLLEPTILKQRVGFGKYAKKMWGTVNKDYVRWLASKGNSKAADALKEMLIVEWAKKELRNERNSQRTETQTTRVDVSANAPAG